MAPMYTKIQCMLSLFYKVIETTASPSPSNKQQEKLAEFYLGLPAHTCFTMAHSAQINLRKIQVNLT